MEKDAQAQQMANLQSIIAALTEQITALREDNAELRPRWADKTVGELLAAALESHWAAKKSCDWQTWAIEKHLAPAFGGLPLRNLSSREVEEFFGRLRDRRVLSNRLRATLKTAWNLGLEWGWIPATAKDPLKTLKKYTEAPRKRTLNDAERAAWERARAELEATAPKLATRFACRAFRLALLCAFRPVEAFSLRRDAVNLERRTVTLTEHKTAHKIGPREIQIPRQAVELLRDTPAIDGSPYFFPGKIAGRPVINPTRAFKTICRHAGLDPKDVQIRDLRRTWGSSALQRGVSLKAISLQLGHTTTAITDKHYAHLTNKAVTEAVDRMGGDL